MDENNTYFFLHAPNVHQGGGKSLLNALLKHLSGKPNVFAQLDRRLKCAHAQPENVRIRSVAPSIFSRIGAECWLRKNASSKARILCFGNLPPLFRLEGKVTVFVQNRYLIDHVPLDGFSFKSRLRIRLERIWFSKMAKNSDEFVVQTPSMKAQLASFLGSNVSVHVRPFVEDAKGFARSLEIQQSPSKKSAGFVYVASGEPHKNHRLLVEAWSILAAEKLFPPLILTLDENTAEDLCTWIGKQKKRWNLNIKNLGVLPYSQIQQLYHQVDALIFPSKFESFGLPLIEARQSDLPVLAPELDYVRDVLVPDQTFDPDSALSIARAVKRFLGMDDGALPLTNAAGFLGSLLDE